MLHIVIGSPGGWQLKFVGLCVQETGRFPLERSNRKLDRFENALRCDADFWHVEIRCSASAVANLSRGLAENLDAGGAPTIRGRHDG